MSLYAIGDLHLSFTANKPMDVFGSEWKDHVRKIDKNWRGRIGAEDTVVITGDHSWGRNLEEALADLDFIQSLPGRKILLRGNHDMFWDAKKTYRLNEMFQGRLSFLQNNYYACGAYALVGTKGYCYEGKDSPEHFEKLVKRELERLRISFELAAADAAANSSCSYIILLPVSERWKAGLLRWQRSTGQSRWCIPTAMGKPGIRTAFWERWTGLSISWFHRIISDSSRRRF